MNTLSYALLGALATQPRTGWELTQHMKAPIALMWAAQHSQIYPELNRLADAGLIRGTVIPGRGPRDTKRYTLTEDGRRALARWADSPLSPDVPRSEMLLRVRSLWLTSPERAIAFLSGQRQHFLDQLGRLTEEKTRFAPDDVMSADHPEFFAFATLQYGLDRVQATLNWCDWLLEQLQRHQRGEPIRVLTAGQPRPVRYR